MGTLIPVLLDQLDQVRAALAAEDWPRAMAILSAHDHQVREEMSWSADVPGVAELVVAQQALMKQMRAERDIAGDKLQAMRLGSVAASAYREFADL